MIDKGRNIDRSRSDPRPHPHRDEVPRVSTGVDLVIIGQWIYQMEWTLAFYVHRLTSSYTQQSVA